MPSGTALDKHLSRSFHSPTCKLFADSSNALVSYEFVSPIITTRAKTQYDSAYSTLKDFFDFMGDHGRTIVNNSSCSMHVHISPVTSEMWNIEFIKRIASAAYYFEPVIRALLPEDRQLVPGFAAEFRSPQLAFMFPKPAMSAKALPPTRTWSKLGNKPTLGSKEIVDKTIYVVNLSEQDVIDNLRHIMDGQCDSIWKIQSYVHAYLSPDKYGAWNFVNMSKYDYSTIEFRKPPPADDFDTAMAWADFAIAFVLAATQLAQPSLQVAAPTDSAAQGTSNSNDSTAQTKAAQISDGAPKRSRPKALESEDFIGKLLGYELSIDGLKKFISASRPASEAGRSDALDKLFADHAQAHIFTFPPLDPKAPKPEGWDSWQVGAEAQSKTAIENSLMNEDVALMLSEELWAELKKRYPGYFDTLWRLLVEKEIKARPSMDDKAKSSYRASRQRDQQNSQAQLAGIRPEKWGFPNIPWDNSYIDEIIKDGDTARAAASITTPTRAPTSAPPAPPGPTAPTAPTVSIAPPAPSSTSTIGAKDTTGVFVTKTDENWKKMQAAYPNYLDTLWRLEVEKHIKLMKLVDKDDANRYRKFCEQRRNTNGDIRFAKSPSELGWDDACIDEIKKAGSSNQTIAPGGNSNTTPANSNTPAAHIASTNTPAAHTTIPPANTAHPN